MPHILVVDDDPSILQLLETALTDAGHEVSLLPDGDQVVNTVAREDIDGIVLDIMMPHVNGLEVLARLRASETGRDVPVLLLTGKDDQATRDAGLAAGASFYVTKPFDVDLLLGTIEMMLATGSASATDPSVEESAAAWAEFGDDLSDM